MLAPLKWIEEFVPLHLPARKVADLFTSIGLECEGIGVVEGTEVLELDTPSNRTDILSIYGLARELAVRTDQPLSPLSTKRAIYSEVGDGAVEIQLLDDQCQHYLGIPLQLSPSPHTDLSEKLLWMGRNPIHPVVDLANVVLFETGQPLHLFGRAHLEKGLQVGVGRTGCFEGLDGEAYDLSPSDLLVLSGEEVLAIAGLLGGCRSAAQEGEGAFYLEAATFAPHRVRRTGRRLSLSTDSSYRFERGVDPQGYLLGAERFLWWVKKLGWGGQEGEGSFVGNSHDASLTIPWQGKEVESRLGFALPPHEEERIFFGLGLERKRQGWAPPSFRSDIRRVEDLLEEVARIHGYQDLPETLPPASGAVARVDDSLEVDRRLVDALVAAGGRQEIRSSLVSRVRAEEGERMGNGGMPPSITNPKTNERSTLRTSLLPGLLFGHSETRRHGELSGWSFEVGRRFGGRGEERALAILIPQDCEEGGWGGTSPLGTSGQLKGMFSHLASLWEGSLEWEKGDLEGAESGTGWRFKGGGWTGWIGAFVIRLGSRSEVVWGGEAQYLLPWPPPSPVGTTPPTQRGIKRDVTRRVQGEEGVIALLSSASTFVHPLLVSATLVDRFVDGDTDALTWRLVIRGDESLEEGEIRTVVEAFEASL